MSKGNKYSKNGSSIANKGGAEESYLVTLLDSLVVAKDITYGEFNNVLSFGPDIEALREAEQQYPELGIAKYGTLEEGVSTISLLATVTSVFCGKRLGVLLQEDDADDIVTPLDEKLILGFTLLDDAGAITDSKKDSETKETEFTSSAGSDKKDAETKETKDAWEVEVPDDPEIPDEVA